MPDEDKTFSGSLHPIDLMKRKIIIGKCLPSMNAVWLILFIIKKETHAAGFKTSKSLCLPEIGR